MGEHIRIGVWSQPGAPGGGGDAWASDDEAGFVVLADGTSLGARAGDVSRVAVEAASARLRARAQGQDVPALLYDVFSSARRAVRGELGRPADPGHGVMLIVALHDGGRLYVAHAGVTRAYLLRAADSGGPVIPATSRFTPAIVLPSGARLTCLTADHSDVAAQVERGDLGRTEAREHPLLGHSDRALGGGESTPDIADLEPAPGDRVLLCSVATWSALDDSALARLLENAGSSQAACIAVARAAQGGAAVGVVDVPKELEPATSVPGGRPTPPKPTGPGAILEQIGRDLTALARDEKLDPVIGREDEIRRLGQILLQRKKANALLVGDAGVGKTCIVEGFAQRIGGPSAPKALRGKRIVEISIAALVAGTKFRGEFEERLQNVIQLAADDPELILFIDEFHTIIGAGAGGEALDAANILKPALARGAIRLIGATTTQEYDRHLSRDEALARRFEVVRVEEPGRAEAVAILKGLTARFEGHYGLTVGEDAFESAVDLSIRYLPERRLPDKAVDLVDQACARRALGAFAGGDAPPSEERTGSIARRDIAEILSERCRVPFDLVNQGDRERLLGLQKYLDGRVFGQQASTSRIAGTLTKAYSGLKDPRRPIASFLFVGPTGVGKTETARALAEYLFVRAECLHRVDMTEFTEKHTIARLIGAPPGYVGHEEEGFLTSAVRRRPASVVLLDEVEKAHPDVLNLLLQILDDGALTDGRGKRASFREAIIVMTTNIIPDKRGGALGFQRDAKPQGSTGNEVDDALREGLKDRFRPELLGRVGAVIAFKALDAGAATAIAEKTIKAVLGRLEAHAGLKELPPEVHAKLVEQAGTLRFGAREIERLVEAEIGKLVEGMPPSVKP